MWIGPGNADPSEGSRLFVRQQQLAGFRAAVALALLPLAISADMNLHPLGVTQYKSSSPSVTA